MLITTYAGLVVNSDHIMYIALKRCETAASDDLVPDSLPAATLHKVLLCLVGNTQVVAATELSYTTVQQLRREIAHRWAEGTAGFDVTEALKRLCVGPTKGESSR